VLLTTKQVGKAVEELAKVLMYNLQNTVVQVRSEETRETNLLITHMVGATSPRELEAVIRSNLKKENMECDIKSEKISTAPCL